jgi:hemerythrin-like domain-containing protein
MSDGLDRRKILAASLAGSIVFTGGLPRLRAEEKEVEVEANEDLMREHGVLRRTLLVYAEAADRLTRGTAPVPATAISRAATLFREFGEDYHERKLKETFVFPAVRQAKAAVAAILDVLVVQHDRGRLITDYVLAVTRGGKISLANTGPLGATLQSFVRMYEHHTAIEDTVVFPAWKAAVPEQEYKELSERFEEIEHQMFGDDGFEDAVKRIAGIEEAFGLADLGKLTAPLPPKPAT